MLTDKLSAARKASTAAFDWLEKDEYPRKAIEGLSPPVQSPPRIFYGPEPGVVYVSSLPPAFEPPPPDDPLEFWADGTFLRWSRPAAVGEQDIHDRILFPWPVEILEGEVGRLCLRTGVDVVEMTWQPGAFMTTVKVALGHWRLP